MTSFVITRFRAQSSGLSPRASIKLCRYGIFFGGLQIKKTVIKLSVALQFLGGQVPPSPELRRCRGENPILVTA